jgi:lipoprotein-anchoring transpeptidase ErfK/SrfK
MLACDREIFDWNDAMRSLEAKLGILAAALMLSGCMQTTTYQAAPEATLKPADKTQLAKARYEKVAVAEPFRRAIVDYHRREQPGTIVVDSDNHYLYLVQDSGKAIRYGITVGEEALAFSGIARVGNMAEWPKWTPTADIHKRRQPARRPRALSLPGQPGHTVPDSRHQPAGIYRRVDLLGLHSHDQ